MIITEDKRLMKIEAADLNKNGECIIPGDVTSIGYRAFQGCRNLNKITIPPSVTLISNWAFRNCWSLKKVTISASVTSIEACAFSGCINLNKITLSANITSIEHGAFLNCSNLKEVTIPTCVTSIGACAFIGCNNLAFICIDAPSDEDKNYQRVKSLIPQNLQAKVILKSTYDEIQKIRENALEKLHQNHNFNPLIQLSVPFPNSFFQKTGPLYHPLSIVNQYLGEEINDIKQAMEAIRALEIPRDATGKIDLKAYARNVATYTTEVYEQANTHLML